MLKLTWKMENIQITFLKLKSNSQKVNKAWRQTSDELPSLRFLTQPCGDAVPAPFRAMKAQKKPDEDVNVHLGLGGGRAGNIFRSFGSWRCFLELNFLWNHQQKILIQLFNRGGGSACMRTGKVVPAGSGVVSQKPCLRLSFQESVKSPNPFFFTKTLFNNSIISLKGQCFAPPIPTKHQGIPFWIWGSQVNQETRCQEWCVKP